MPDIGYTAIGATASNMENSRFQAITMPENGVLDSISVHIAGDSRGGAENTRVALYVGGASDTDPTGATLVEDLGILPGAGTTGWRTVTSSTTPSLTSGNRYWLAVKGNATFGLQYSRDDSPADPLDIIATPRFAVVASTDETVAWETPVSSAGSSTSGYTSLYLTYSTGGSGTSVHDSQEDIAEAGDIWTISTLTSSESVHDEWTEGSEHGEGFSTFEIFDTDDEGASGGDEWTTNVVTVSGSESAQDSTTEGTESGDEWLVTVVSRASWEEIGEGGDPWGVQQVPPAPSNGAARMHIRTGLGI